MIGLRPRLALAFAAAAVCAGGLAAAGPADEPGFKPLFNGKDLDGWDGDPSLWSVKDGAITGVTSKEHPLTYNKFLIYRGGKPKNFHLKASFRLVGDNNSGIQYRSKELPKVGKWSVGGYQADIHPAPNYCGMLYDERGRGIVAEAGQKVVVDAKGKKKVVGKTDEVKPTKLDDWNEIEVIAVGNHLVHKINGRTTVDVTDEQESEREFEGLIALQVHAGPVMTVQYRSITLKALPDDAPKAAAKPARRQQPPQGPAPEITAPEKLKPPAGFKVELVHAVPRESEGSWVSMTVDPKGRLILSDQYGKLYRVTPSPVGGPASETKVEPIDLNLGGAHGLLWAFDSLYVMNNEAQGGERGLYRVRDTDGDDKLDKVELLRKLDGGGEHGPHAIVLSPDGKSLYVVAGNATRLPELSNSLVPRVWGEDNLLPYMPDGAGFMTNERAPGGWVCRIDPDGKDWELVSTGYRNPYDIAFNRDGELFTYDSDMEWDMNLPWYRPTRVCQAVSGSDFGYRNGSGKFPAYYLDSLPPVVNIGPGSPTGITFGYGAKFPAKYQDALFISDWSYGKLYALHLKPTGAGYAAEVEEFLRGSPLPLTDLTVRPQDGALYFAIGGRRTSSGLYRIVYNGPDSTEPSKAETERNEPTRLRRRLESFHGKPNGKNADAIWPYLGHADRFVASAARIALEFQDVSLWKDKALTERDPAKALPALLSLVRLSASDPMNRKPGDPAPARSADLRSAVLAALARFASETVSNVSSAQVETRTLDLLRVYEVTLNRLGIPGKDEAERLADRLRPIFPSKSRALNTELGQIFTALQTPDAAEKLVGLLAAAPTQEEQIVYAADLRLVESGWRPELRMAYFAWFIKAAGYKGGNSFKGFMRQIRDGAVAHLSEAEKADLKPIIEAPQILSTAAARPASPAPPSRPVVKNWTLDELVPLVETNLRGRNYDRGRSLFAAAQCFSCHRFNNEGGGAGPELTGLAGRFTVRDLLESVTAPSKVISDQYAAVQVATADGQVVTGRIVNLHNDAITINTNMLDPNLLVNVDRKKIEEMKPSPVSMMPEGLFNTLNRDEVLDLVAYLLSRGDRNADAYKRP